MRLEGKTKFPAQFKVRPGPSGQMRFIHGGHVQLQVLAMSSFKSRKQQESSMKLGKAIKFKDAERRKCSKLVIPHMQKMIAGLVGAFKEKSSTQGIGNFTGLRIRVGPAVTRSIAAQPGRGSARPRPPV